jgi:hypothetical protein
LLVLLEVLRAQLQLKLIINLPNLISLIVSHFVHIYHIISSLWRTDTTLSLRCGQRIPHYLFVVANGYHIISSLWPTDTTLSLRCGERIPHYLFVVANGYHIISSLWPTDTHRNTQISIQSLLIKVYHSSIYIF